MTKIAITDCVKYEEYRNWLLIFDSHIECTRLSYRADNITSLHSCDGLLLTGGGDVDPALYYQRILANRGENVPQDKVAWHIPQEEKRLCLDVDRKRDDFELQSIDLALARKIPVLGICRGLQIANVLFGGTLIRDLGERNRVHRKENDVAKKHAVVIRRGTYLEKISGTARGVVNSTHHQAVEDPGSDLIVSAESEDGVAEALEMKKSACLDFFLLVQWHPELMEYRDDPLCKTIGSSFLSAAKER